MIVLSLYKGFVVDKSFIANRLHIKKCPERAKKGKLEMLIVKFAIGEALKQDCPDNDCRLFLNTYNMVTEAAAAYNEIETSGKYTETTLSLLRKGIREQISFLHDMNCNNFAIKQYKKTHTVSPVVISGRPAR